jgi:hypothetical protein
MGRGARTQRVQANRRRGGLARAPVLADYAPWVVPLTVRPNGEHAADTADD